MRKLPPVSQFIALIIVVVGFIYGAQAVDTTPTETKNVTATPSSAVKEQTMVTISTTKGDITIELYESDAPKTTKNFKELAQKGYYNGVIFHRVIKGFMIQGGDPNGTGAGGESIYGHTFEDELNPNTESYKTGYKEGVVAMANRGPNTNGSQFFIMLQDTPLPKNYTIFGRVAAGMDVVHAIGNTPVDGGDRPLEEVKMTAVKVGE